MKSQKVLMCLILIIVLMNTYFIFFGKKSNLKIAYVDNMKVYQNYKGMEEVKKAVEENSKKYKSNLDTLQLDFEKELKNYEKTRKKMSDKEKALTEKLLQNKQQQYMHYKDAADKKEKDEQVNITQQLLKKLDEYMKKYAKAKGYDFILGATSSANIIYAKEVYNITDELIKEVNIQYENKK